MKKIFTLLFALSIFSYSQVDAQTCAGQPLGHIIQTNAPCPAGQVGTGTTVTIVCDGAGGILTTQISGPDCVLPVELTRFEAVSTDEGIVLQWETASELNNERFEILRSYDGVRFDVVDEIEGAGTSSDLSIYEYTDKSAAFNAPGNEAFYRLKQVDFDGEMTLSDVISTKLEGVGSFNIGRILSTQDENITIYFESVNEGLVVGNLYDINGRLIASQENMTEKGFSSLVLSAKTQNGQMYILTLNNGSEIISKKFIL